MRERAPPGEGIICLVFFVAAGYPGRESNLPEQCVTKLF